MDGRKDKAASARKRIKRKPKNKPKRALSAYNYFFKEERQKIVKAVFCMDDRYRKVIDPSLTEDQIKQLVKRNGQVNFEEIGKIIGARWRRISDTPDRVHYYNSLAKIDAERYAKDKANIERRNEDRNYEQSNPPNSYHSTYQMPYHMHIQAPSINTFQTSMHHGQLGHTESQYFDHGHRYEQTTFSNNFGFDTPRAADQHRSYNGNLYARSMR